METDRIKSIFDDFLQQNRMFLSDADEFIEYSNGVAETMVPIVKSFNLNTTDEEFGYFCAFFHRINELENTDSETLYGEEGLLTKAFPDNYANYEFILRDVMNAWKPAVQPVISDQRTATFVHLLRDSIFLYKAKRAESLQPDDKKVISDTLSREVKKKISFDLAIFPEDVVTEADEFARQISAFQGVVFIKSKDIVEDYNYFTNLCNSVTVTDPKTNEQISKLKEFVSGYLTKRENITAYHASETVRRFSFPPVIKLVGLAFILAAIIGTFFMCKSMVNLSRTPDWQALKQSGKAKSFFGNPFEVVFGGSSDSFSTDFDESISKSLLGIWALCEDGQPITAMSSLADRLSKNSNDIEAAVLMTDICMRYGYYGYFDSIFNAYLAGKKTSANDVARINSYMVKLDAMDTTLEVIEDIISKNPFDATKDDIEEYRQKLTKEFTALLDNKNYDKEVIYEYLMMSANKDYDIQKYALKESELYPYNTYSLSRLAVSYRRCGRQANAVDVIEKAYKINREDIDLIRAYATIEMVSGNMEHALALAESAYNDSPDGDYVIETYLIALCENNRKSDATTIYNQLLSQSYVFEPDFLNYWNGTINVHDYYVDKEGN